MTTPITLNSSDPAGLTVGQVPIYPLSPVSAWKVASIGARISAGFPSPAADYTEQKLDLNEYLIPHKASTFIFTVEGDSMRDAGIFDGDKVVVDRSIEPRHRHIIIAVVNSEYTIKRLYKRGGIIELRPENAAFKPIKFGDMDELCIWGVVTSVIRRISV